jgi:asparagine synthase (glutamine-hydrolysing)
MGYVSVAHFNGMCCIAIWDEKQRKSCYCKDRLGIKPLYYYGARSISFFFGDIRAIVSSRVGHWQDSKGKFMRLSFLPNR